MERTQSAYLGHNVKVANAPNFNFHLIKLIPISAILALPLIIKISIYMDQIFTERVKIHNIVQILSSIASKKYLMEATVIISTGAIREFVIINYAHAVRHPIVQFLQISNALIITATIFRNQMGKLAQLTQHAHLEFVRMACAMAI